MARPFLRYLPAKLKPVSAPAVWIPLTIFTLLSILLWEYYQNPEWFERDPIANANPESALTPDEQARLAEIDTVDLLLQGAQATGPLSNPISLEDSSEDSLEKSTDGLKTSNSDANVSRRLADQSNPFGTYAAEYEFSGAASNTPLSTSSLTSRQSPATASFTPTAPIKANGPEETTALLAGSSAFSNAINQQQTTQQQTIRLNRSQAQRSSDPASEQFLNSSENDLQNSGASFTQTGSRTSVPFSRTTPAMSPPAGTTGYQAPSTANLPNFNLAPPQATRNPYNATVSPGAIAPGQIGTIQSPSTAKSIQPSPVAPASTIYTAPSATQPEQNRRAR